MTSDLLRIAFCLPEVKWFHPPSRGDLPEAAFIQQRYIAEGLRSRGHSLTYIAPHEFNRIVCTNNVRDLKPAPLTWSGTRWFNLASQGTWRLQQWLGIPYLNVFSNYRRYDACLRCLPGHDLAYERNSLYNIFVAMACKKLKLPYVLFFDADQILEQDFIGKPITGLLRWRASFLLRQNLTMADCVICVSNLVKTHLMTAWEVPSHKIVVFPNGVDVNRFHPHPETSSEVRASLGVNNKPLIIFVGSFYKWHDVATLLVAFSKVVKIYPEARLVLVGDGSQHQAMIHLSVELGINQTVRFTGQVPHSDIPQLLSAADIAVAPIPPMKQGLWLSPMKLFEYMASGNAVIATKSGQLAEVVNDGYNGLLIPPGDVIALTTALVRLIEDKDFRLQLGQHAREDAITKYSWEKYLSRLERIFTAVIAGNHFDHA